MDRIKQKIADVHYKTRTWFHTRENYQRHFNPHTFFFNILYFLIAFLFTLFVNKEIQFLNQYNILFIRIGSTLLLCGLYFMIKYAYYILKQFRDKHYNLSRGQKTIIALLIIVFLFLIYTFSTESTEIIQKTLDKIELSNFNPFSISEIVGDSNVISPDVISSKLDLRKFTNFLPQPWGFLIFWAFIVGGFIMLLSKFVFGGYLPRWLIWALVIIAVIMAFQYKIPYDTVEVSGFNMKCSPEGKVLIEEEGMFGVMELAGKMELSMSCMEYKSSQCRPLCINNKPMCQCEANLIDQIFHQKGDWILGA